MSSVVVRPEMDSPIPEVDVSPSSPKPSPAKRRKQTSDSMRHKRRGLLVIRFYRESKRGENNFLNVDMISCLYLSALHVFTNDLKYLADCQFRHQTKILQCAMKVPRNTVVDVQI